MRSPVITRLTLKRFRSVPSQRIDFDNPTIFVGQNGSGKSNVVDAFGFLADAMNSPLQAVFDRRGGISAVRNRSSGKSYPPNLGFRVELGALNGSTRGGHYAFEIRALPDYGFEVIQEQCLTYNGKGERAWFDRRRQGFHSNVSALDPALDAASLVLPLVGGNARFAPVVRALAGMRVYAIEPARLREMQDPDGGTSLRRDGGNCASVLQDIARQRPADLKRLREILATIVPHTVSFEVKKHGNKLSLEFTQEWGEEKRKRLKFEAFNMSEGTLRALGVLTAVYQNPTPSLLAIEEPEATIHVGALSSLMDALRHAAKHMQVVVTTHSPDVLDTKWVTDSQLRVVEWAEGATRIGRVSDRAREALREHLMDAGELLRSNVLDVGGLFTEVEQPTLFEALA